MPFNDDDYKPAYKPMVTPTVPVYTGPAKAEEEDDDDEKKPKVLSKEWNAQTDAAINAWWKSVNQPNQFDWSRDVRYGGQLNYQPPTYQNVTQPAQQYGYNYATSNVPIWMRGGMPFVPPSYTPATPYPTQPQPAWNPARPMVFAQTQNTGGTKSDPYNTPTVGGGKTPVKYQDMPFNYNFDPRTGKPANSSPAPLSPLTEKPAGEGPGKPKPFKEGGYTLEEIVDPNAEEGQRGFDWSKARYGTPPSYNQGPYQNNTQPHVAGYYLWGGKYYPIGGVTPGVGIRGLEDGSYKNYWGWWNLGPYLPKAYQPTYYSGGGGSGGGWGGYGGGYGYGNNSSAWLQGLMNWNIG